MASKNVLKLSPVRSVTIPRCTTEGDWAVSDMAVRGNKLAVSRYSYRTDATFIDLFTLNGPDSSSPLMTQLFSRVFHYQAWPFSRHVSFLDDSHVVTTYIYLVQVYHIEADDSEPLHTVNLLHDTIARCVTVREGEIFISLFRSNEVIVFDFSLNKIKTITLNGLREYRYPKDMTVYGDNLFISTGSRAIRCNMEGNIVHEYKAPGYSETYSITVSGLVYILWDLLHVVVYSLSDSQQLMSFDVDDSTRIRIVDVNRLLAVDSSGEVREYSLDLLQKRYLQKAYAEMTRSDSENLANFFMFPLKHVKAIINSPSHSEDLLVELENKGIIQSALTDELFENLGALNILTGRSEGSKSSIKRPSSTYLKHEEDWKPPDTMKITSSISEKGGLLQIPNTGIKLVFPPNAVTEERNIQVKIIPPSLLNEPATSFSSNSSVVLELLPNGLQLKREVSLTLPHCLTFINEEKAKAKVYVSHHEEGQRPRWEERPLSPYIFHRSKCTVRLLGFCWVKIVIDDKEVEAKNIVVFATKDILQDNKTANLEVGYYEDIPECGEPNMLELNPDMKPAKKLKLKFLKEGKQPLTISFNGTDPGNTWAIEQDKPQKEISWQSIAGSEDRLVSFVLHRKQPQDSFCNVSAQQGNSDPIIFVLKLKVDQSTGEILDRKVPDSILKYLATELAEEWQTLARCLNISDADLHNIEANNSRRMQDTKYFMLRHWSEMNGTGATCRVLATALDKADRRDLKQYVKRQDRNLLRIGNLHTKSKTMASKNVSKLSPIRSVTIPRCTTERDWKVTDMAVRGNKLAVYGYNNRTDTQSFIDLFTLNDPDSSSPLMTQLYTKLFDHPRWQHRYVSILDDSHIVYVYVDIVQVYHIEADDSEPSHTVNLLQNRIAKCVTVREGEIFIGLSSDEVIVFDFSLNKIKTITLKGLKRHPFFVHLDITVYGDNLFISTYYKIRNTFGRSAIRYNMEGKIVHEYKTPGYSSAYSITVSGLVYVLWGCLHVVVYSLSDSQQLMSFDVDDSTRIRIVDVNRLLTVDRFTGEVREYSMDFNLLTKRYLQKVFAEMTRSDTEHLANFFMLPLEHVKAIINSPSHSKDLFVELENRGIIQSALTDEFSENLGALNILTGRSEGSKSCIRIPSSTFRKQEEGGYIPEEEERGYIPEEEEGASGYIPEKEEDWKPPDTMKITSSISEKGGLLQIPNTGIKLVFPPNAVTEEHNIQVKMVPPSLLNEPATSFSSNSSVVLELLPNGLQLKREVSLTLPHCLTFINEEKAKAKVYVSHHEEGQRPCWEERPLSPYIFHRSKCTVRLLGFCWVKIVIDDKEVEAKNIVVFATKDILQDKKTANLEVGYYEDIPGEPNILELNPDMKPAKKLKLKFLKEGKQPLTISFNGTDPGNTWAIEQDKPKKEISWQSIAGSEDRLVSFVLQRKETQDSFCNVSAQQGNSDPIIFVLKLEGNQSTVEILDRKVPDSILKYLAEKPEFSEWQRLARYLNISDADLDNLKEDNRRCHQDTKYFMLHLWRKRNGTGATCRVLATALDKAGRKDLQQYVERQDRNLLRIEYLHTKSKTMASKNVSKLSPVRSVTIPRFKKERDWCVIDMAVRGNKLAVCVHNDRTDTFIDLFTLNDPDSSSRLMTQLCTKNVFVHPRWWYLCVSFLDDSHIVTVCRDHVHVYHIEADDSEPLHTVYLLHNGMAKCVTVREGEIFIGLYSNEVIVLDFSLNEIKTITLEGIEGYPADITVYGDDLFISTVDLRGIRYNMEGKIVHEYKTPGYSRALSITVSGLVYILWNYLHVVVYSLSDSQQLMSFDVDFTDRFRIVDVNRLLTVCSSTCEVREYSLPPDVLTLLKQELFSEMTRSDCENLANFFMLPLKHVKAIVNSPSHSKDLLVELENKGIIQSALTDEFSENLRALNIKLLTGISEGSKSSIHRHSPTLLKKVKGKGSYSSIESSPSALYKRDMQMLTLEEDEGSKSSIRRPSPTFLKREEGEQRKSSINRSSSTFHKQQLTVGEDEDEGSKSSIRRPSPTFLKREEGEQRKSSINRSSSTFHKQQLTVGEEEDWKPPDTMTITSSISGKGGLLQIPNTGIKLVFPPNAVTEELNIQVKIIPPSVLNEPATSFSSNSSVVLELLPNGLQLKREVSLTLPHCLTFINEEKAKAKVYVSHHEEGQRPCWEERPLSPYIFHRSKCTLRLLGFCWVKIVIDDKEVEAKNIVVFATKDILQDKKTANLEVGYYEDIPERGEPNILELNPDMKPAKKLKLKFLKEGKQPLTISFNGTDPGNTWAIEQDKPKKEISWQSIAGSEDHLVSFVLQRKQTQDSFCNVSAQQGNSDPIIFVLKLEGNQSTGEIADSTVPDCILEYLAEKLDSEWQSLARYLNISDADLDNLKEDNRRCHQDTKYFMLRHWRKRNDTKATCRVLATALGKADRIDLQQYVERHDRNLLQIEYLHTKSKTMASKNVSKLSPVRSDTVPRCTTERGWFVTDMAVRGNKLAVSVNNNRTHTQAFIDLFTLNDPDSSLLLMTKLCTKAFDHSRWRYHHVSFLDDSCIVTACCDLVHVYHIEADDSEPSHTVNLLHNRSAKCMTVREGEIFIGLLNSNEVIVLDFSLNKIKTITLKGLNRYVYPVDITVYGDNLFISTDTRRAIRYNMEGKIVHEYKAPGYSSAWSITVSGLVYILWDCPHVVVYSLSDSQQLMSFDVDESHRIMIVDVNRLFTVNYFTCEVREYSLARDPSSVKQPSTPVSDRVVTTAAIQKRYIQYSKNQVLSKSLRVMLMINKEGGRLDIPDTGASLEIPSGALEGEQFIQMIIIPPHLESESLTFASNSSLVVELLPSNLKLMKPAILTLPHCLVLKKGCEWKAKIYRSHHKEGSEPQWEEQSNTHYELGEHNCVIEIQRFSWEKIEILDKIVEAKNIVVYAAGRCGPTDSMYLDIGYYWDLVTCVEVISFEKVAINKGTFCTFVLNRTEPMGTDTCTCLFKAGQAPNLEDYTFLLKAPDPSSVKQPSTSNRQDDERVGTSTAGIEASDRVVTTATLQNLSQRFCHEWIDVSRTLGIEEATLSDIQRRIMFTRHQAYEMLDTWKKLNGEKATYKLLGEALIAAGRTDLYEEFIPQDSGDQPIKLKHKNEDIVRRRSKISLTTETERASAGGGTGQSTSTMKSRERASVGGGRGKSQIILIMILIIIIILYIALY
ncbi:uncharacterized protein [Apostichopus japonicus]|uniref:uncharacterized protein isoform X3 n=1 Tax=Stichopus japonicus TaxID=307972 RepID=UPI003AB1D9DD